MLALNPWGELLETPVEPFISVQGETPETLDPNP